MTETRPPAGHAARSEPAPQRGRYADAGLGWTLAMELLTATFVWGGIGWLVDGWLGTGPVLMAIGFVLGNGLGIYLIWLRSSDRFANDRADALARRGSVNVRPPRNADRR
jgi:ATP synthase protein I